MFLHGLEFDDGSLRCSKSCCVLCESTPPHCKAIWTRSDLTFYPWEVSASIEGFILLGWWCLEICHGNR